MTNVIFNIYFYRRLGRWAILCIFFLTYSWETVSRPLVYRNKTFNGDIRFVLGPEDSGTKFINCTFKNYVGGADVLRIAGATDILIRGCTFVNIQGNEKGRDMHAIACPQNGKRIVIEDCTFKDVSADGIQMGHRGKNIRNWKIRGNFFEQCGENGIDIKKVKGNILVAGNTFSEHTGCPPGSIGCTGGSGAGLVIHHGASGVIVKNNRFYKNTRGLAIFVTNDKLVARNIKIVNNFFYNNRKGVEMHHGKRISIHHNTFVNHTEKHIGINDRLGNWLSYKNNFLVGRGKILKQYKGKGNLYLPSVNEAKFFNPSKSDFRLQSDSPAVDAGVIVNRVMTDWKGMSRPQGGRHDVGADEKKISSNSP